MHKTITVGGAAVVVDVANTEALRERGLSGRAALAPNSGMLFVFGQRGDWGIWMKDMNFPIDIVFVSDTSEQGVGSVVSVVHDASPDSYKKSPPDIFYPPLAVPYVIELPQGFAAAHGVAVGTKVVL